MSNPRRTKAELAAELAAVRRRVAELEARAPGRGPGKAAHRDHAEWLRFIFENAFDGISIHEEGFDPDVPRRLLDCNERYAELAGRPKAELLALGDTRSIQLPAPPSGDVPASRSGAEAAAVLAAGQPYRGRFAWLRPDGRENIIEFVAVPLRRGDRILTVGVDRDVTEQTRWETALRDSEERFRAIFEQAADSVVLMDASTMAFAEFNRRAHENLGYTRGEFARLALGDIEAVESPADAAAHIARIVRGGADQFETRHRTKTGEIRDVHVSVRHVSIRGRDFLLGVWRDITERIRAEREQAASLARLRRQQDALVRLATSANVARGDFDAAAAEITETAANALGVARAAIWLGTREEGLIRCIDLYDRPSGAHSAGLRLPMDKYPLYFAALESERVVAAEHAPDDPRTREFAEGYLRPVGIGSMLDAPIRVAGQLVGIVSHEHIGPPRPWLADEVRFAGEIADQAAQALLNAHRRRTEEALRFTQFAVDHAADAAFWIDADGRFLYVNDAACRALGYSRAEFHALRVPSIVPAIPRETWLARWHQLKQAGQATHETRLRAQDGRDFPVEVSLNFVEFEGRPYLCAFARDITERTRAEAERRSLEARMQETARLESLGLLAGGVAHDFNNLLMGVLGNADLALADLPLASPARESLRDIVTAARRAADLCKQLLAYAGKGRFVVDYLDLNALVEEMTRLLEVSISKKAMLRCHLAHDLPAIEADPTQVRQILLNLITNASEALGDQPGVIAVATAVLQCSRDDLAAAHPAAAHLTDDLPDGPYVLLEVADSGCGMDPETLSRIFDPFFSTKFVGRGLGLAAVLGIVRGHRGTVKVQSQPGRGTTFQILFPAARHPAAAPAEAPREPDVAGSGRTILLADDEPTVRLVAQRMLERAGFRVLVAADGQQAVDLFRQHADDVACVVLDLTMPHMDGDETFRELRSIRADVSVILSSGYNEQDVVSRFAGRGLAGFVQKPYRMSDLRSAVRAALVKRGKE